MVFSWSRKEPLRRKRVVRFRPKQVATPPPVRPELGARSMLHVGLSMPEDESEVTIYHPCVSTPSQIALLIDTENGDDHDIFSLMMGRPDRTDRVHHFATATNMASEVTIRTIHGEETWYKIARDIVIPVTVVGCSLVVSGYLFTEFRSDDDSAFAALKEMSVLVAPLFRLKSNLEMVNVAKLSTQLNLGNLKSTGAKVNYVAADTCATQAQSIVAGYIAAAISILFTALLFDHFSRANSIYTIIASAVLTASLTAFLFGILASVMLFALHRFHINPDNVAIPLACSLGELSTLATLYGVSHWLYVNQLNKDTVKFSRAICCFCVITVPVWGFMAYKYEGSLKPLFECWFPVLASMILSCGAGLLLAYTGDQFDNMSLYQPLITGVGGNLVSVHYCRIITAYHRIGTPGIVPGVNGREGKICYNPIDMMFRLGIHTRGFWVFIVYIMPAQLAFSLLVYQFAHDHARECYGSFLWMYVLVCGLDLVILLYLTMTMTNFLWTRKIDPSPYVIPFIHGIGDLLGTSLLLFCCFMLLRSNCKTSGPMKASVVDIPEETEYGEGHFWTLQ